jgi:hypothetical protein
MADNEQAEGAVDGEAAPAKKGKLKLIIAASSPSSPPAEAHGSS